MTFTGVVRGKSIEISEALPFDEGEAVDVVIEPAQQPRRGSPAAILAALASAPHVSDETVDEFERLIEEGKRPPIERGVFDDLD
jgi:hypothetical protein